MILLDTNVLSEVRHPRGSAVVKAWMSALDRDTTFISVVSLAEIAKGIARLPAGPWNVTAGPPGSGLSSHLMSSGL